MAFGQIPNPVPPESGIPTGVYLTRIQHQIRQSPLPPVGGFWVIEEVPETPAIIHFYTDGWHEIKTDTLRRKRLNLNKRRMIVRLNRHLHSVLDTQPDKDPIAARRP